MRTEEQHAGESVRRMILLGILLSSSWLVSGCVVLEEKYSAEKARSVNFQRLLVQEEKRTAELESELNHAKVELVELESRNRELSAQVQVVREQNARLQEETEAIREATLLERKALEDMHRKPSSPSVKPKKSEPRKSTVTELGANSSLATGRPAAAEVHSVLKANGIVHVVKPGETLSGISRQYGIEADQLKKMNKLSDDIIEVGQKLKVGTE
jgi:LysM repeat protein